MSTSLKTQADNCDLKTNNATIFILRSNPLPVIFRNAGFIRSAINDATIHNNANPEDTISDAKISVNLTARSPRRTRKAMCLMDLEDVCEQYTTTHAQCLSGTGLSQTDTVSA